jgi:hypothetical protein
MFRFNNDHLSKIALVSLVCCLSCCSNNQNTEQSIELKKTENLPDKSKKETFYEIIDSLNNVILKLTNDLELIGLSDVEIKTNPDTFSKSLIDNIFKEWHAYLISHNMFDCVTTEECENFLENVQERGVPYPFYPMTPYIDTISMVIPVELNNDGITDYLINYSLNNCVNGAGRGSYTNDFVIVMSKNNKYYFNIQLTHRLKRAYLKFLSARYPSDQFYASSFGFYIETRGLYLEGCKKVNNKTYIIGNCAIDNDGNDWSDYLADFSFNIESNEFEHTNMVVPKHHN